MLDSDTCALSAPEGRPPLPVLPATEGYPGDPSIQRIGLRKQITPTLGPNYCKDELHWAFSIPIRFML